jgi:hypothetical protein
MYKPLQKFLLAGRIVLGAVMLLFSLWVIARTASPAHADVISRFLQTRSATAQWADYIYQNQSGQHRITPETAQRIAQAVVIASSNYAIAPDVIIGLMKTESGFDPHARSRSGALGLMQVVPYWHRVRIAGRNLFHIEAAIDIGVAILAQYQKRSKDSLAGALRLYCGYRPKAARIYVAKVMDAHDKAFRSLRVARLAQVAADRELETSTLLRQTAYTLRKPEENPLEVSTDTEQKLARLSAFDGMAYPTVLPSKVYLQDPFADLTRLPGPLKRVMPPKSFLDSAEESLLQWG